MKRSNRAASAGKVLKVTDQEDSEDLLEKRQDQTDVAAAEQKKVEEKAIDKVGSVLDHAPYVLDQSPTQVFGAAVIEEFKGDVAKIPKWLFKRWYFRDRAIIDLFVTQRAYDEADVEARRALAAKFNVRYAALGPRHSYRTDLPQQLGL